MFDCRHPLSGQKLTLREWLSADLHHWETAEGQENKYSCRLIDLIPLLRKNIGITPEHASITQKIKNGEGVTLGDTFQDIISSVLDGEAPSRDIWTNPKDRKDFELYYEINGEAMETIIGFLTHFDSDYLRDLGI